MKRIPVLEAGSRLEQGGAYFDLRHPESGTFQAAGYQLWNLIMGVDNWDRLGSLVDEAADESEREPGPVL